MFYKRGADAAHGRQGDGMEQTDGFARTWVVHGLWGAYRLVLDAARAPAGTRVPAPFVLDALDAWLRDPFTSRTLASLDEALGGMTPVAPTSWALDAHLAQRKARLARALESGRLQVLEVPHALDSTLLKRAPAPPPPPPRDVAPVAWVGVQLVDADGAPVRGQRLRLRLPDGTSREGSSDSTGRYQLPDVPPGACTLELLDVDAQAWRAA